MKKKAKMLALSTLAMLGLTVNSETLWAQGYFSTIAQSGQAIPVGTGTFSTFQAPLLNNSGQTAFLSNLTGTSGGAADNQGIFLGSGGTLTQIVREGESANGNGTYSSFLNVLLNNSGQVAFRANLIGTSGINDNQGIFQGSGGPVTQIVRRGQLFGGSFNFISLGPGAFNDSGDVAFKAGDGDFNNPGEAVYRGSGAAPTSIAAGNTSSPVLNNLGQAAFYLFDFDGNGTGIYLGSGEALIQIASAGQAAQGGGDYSSFSSNVALNDSGQVAFRASLTGTSEGIFRGTGVSTTQIARRGQLAPGNNGWFDSFGALVLNDSGQTAFRATLTGTPDDAGIFIGNGGAVTQIARKGQAAPNGNGTLTNISTNSFGLNNSGQAAFSASNDRQTPKCCRMAVASANRESRL